jgi:hypothetical protein
MKTTIDLPDGLAADARALAREERLTLRELVVDGLRSEIERRRAASPRVDFVFPVVQGNGLRPGVDRSHLIALAYDLP